MILLIDAGNTRLKWRLAMSGAAAVEGVSVIGAPEPLKELEGYWAHVSGVFVSSVASRSAKERLDALLGSHTVAPVQYCWSESARMGLVNSYKDVSLMGADRWHAMLGGWVRCGAAFAVIDAGSAVTVDYVGPDGGHIGGYILPGLQMMRRSLKVDAARIGFEHHDVLSTTPGQSTGECVNNGLSWLSEAVVHRLLRDLSAYNLGSVFLTGGDAWRFQGLGLQSVFVEGLVLDGLGQRVGVGQDK